MAKKQRRLLAGRVVAITGAARGIGRATAKALVAKGAKVAIGDLELDLAVKTAGELGGGTIAMPLDVTDRASFERFLDEAEKQLGPLDVLINNAGIMPVGPFVDEDEASARRQVDINLHGVIAGTQLALHRMRPRRSGHIVNIASSAGKAGVPGIATYSATKHAVVGLSEAVRAELRHEGLAIDVSCVMPVPVRTGLMEGVTDQRIIKQVEPEDVAAEIVDALEAPRFDVFVPRWLKSTVATGAIMPRRAREAVSRFMGVENLLTDIDLDKRRAYEDRAAHSRSVDSEGEAEREQEQPEPAAAERDAA